MATRKRTRPLKARRGRQSAYTPELRDIAANIASGGATDLEIAERLGISRATLYRWRNEHSDFREALRVGKEAADDRVETSLYHRAVGYSYPAVKVMQNKGRPVIVPYTEHVPPDIGAITLWLTNRRPDKWKARQALEGVPGSQPITVEIRQFGGADQSPNAGAK